ncbi:SDR family NAD(P)-dependent oxidoreductase [Rhizobiaceae bacterium n13]|uniref:Probable oxidoreductase n=1 Tax=Ferirhizobium litorale TaxID=2927786 RepID=A0AAE3QH52_9HYPH|nr:SDR family NAD(P)-dependent oxidoreductase [Fererhizobium litorale]MDI7864237.1 SDR family NAD(P)-dependent oxidoreductase [Fererhizobium litorale]MDI7925120.1 SDR family NAD(P)-dependent oxidoreductase [Fererhizobium litorale]
MASIQKPLATGWGPTATAEDVAGGLNFSGKTVIVTGGASGLGLETSRALAKMGAAVIVPARRPEEARTELAGIPGVEVAEINLMDPASIDGFAESLLASGQPLDRLILSAGVMATPLFRDAGGNEGQFATNHLGHFRLTARLWPALLASGNARVVVLSSRGHQISGLDLDDLAFVRRPYDKWLAYGQSKTANALFAVALDARGREHGIRAFSVHPGSILSPLARHLTSDEIDAFGAVDADGAPVIDPARDMKNPAQGAATTVWCATSPLLEDLGGLYCEDSDIAALEEQDRRGVRPYAVDPAVAEKLWEESVRLTGTDLQWRA